MATDDDLARALDAAKQRLDAASAAMRARHRGGERDAWREAYDALLEAERALALSRGDECAVPCEGFPRWDTGAPMPHVLTSGGRTELVYLVSEPDPAWDGTTVRVRSATDGEANPVARATFTWCASVRFGSPNDEVLHGHALHGRGLRAYGAHRVCNSRWIAELEQVNRVHSQYNAARWRARHHYLLAFHDNVFECIAERFEVEVTREPFADALSAALARLITRL